MPCWPLPPAQWTSELCLGRNCKQICARQPELDFHLSRPVPKAPPEEEEGDCPCAQHSLCPCAHTHVPFPDACPPCTLHPDRLRRAPAALWASRPLQGKEELIKLEAADKRTHGLKRPRPVAQATPSPSSGRMRPKPPPHCAIHPGGTPACIQLSPTTSPRNSGRLGPY